MYEISFQNVSLGNYNHTFGLKVKVFVSFEMAPFLQILHSGYKIPSSVFHLLRRSFIALWTCFFSRGKIPRVHRML